MKRKGVRGGEGRRRYLSRDRSKGRGRPGIGRCKSIDSSRIQFKEHTRWGTITTFEGGKNRWEDLDAV